MKVQVFPGHISRGVDLDLGLWTHGSDDIHRDMGVCRRAMEFGGRGWRGRGTVGEGVGVAPSADGLCQPPRSERPEASVLGSRPTYLFIVCSGHPLGQQRRQERLVWKATATEQGLPSRLFIQR